MTYDPCPREPQNKELQALELTVRTYNALRAWRPNITIKELCQISDEDLLRVPGLGRRGIRDLREMIDAMAGLDRAETKRLHEWVETHRTLVRALMHGEAVIVPLSVMKVSRLELPR